MHPGSRRPWGASARLAALALCLGLAACINETDDPALDVGSGDETSNCLASGAACGGGPICCSPLICKGGRCSSDAACSGGGAHCRSSGDCCGLLTCRNGVCSGTTDCRGRDEHCAGSADCCGTLLCRDGHCR